MLYNLFLAATSILSLSQPSRVVVKDDTVPGGINYDEIHVSYSQYNYVKFTTKVKHLDKNVSNNDIFLITVETTFYKPMVQGYISNTNWEGCVSSLSSTEQAIINYNYNNRSNAYYGTTEKYIGMLRKEPNSALFYYDPISCFDENTTIYSHYYLTAFNDFNIQPRFMERIKYDHPLKIGISVLIFSFDFSIDEYTEYKGETISIEIGKYKQILM